MGGHKCLVCVSVFPLAGNYQVSPGQIYNKKPEKVKKTYWPKCPVIMLI